jgi:integrase/recombinase XerD
LAKKKLALKTLEQRAAANWLFFIKLLRQHYLPENIPFPTLPRRLPTVLSQEEVPRMLECKINLMHRAMLLTLYST